MNRRSLSIIIIGLISVIIVSSIIAYELGFITPNVPSSTSPSVLWQRPFDHFATGLAVDDGKVFTSDSLHNINCFDSQSGESIWNGSGDVSGIAKLGSRMYVGIPEREVRCLDENTGERLWSFQNEQAPGRIFEGSPGIMVKDGRLFAITDIVGAHNATTGELLWQAIPVYGNSVGTIMEPNNTWSGGWVNGFPLDGDPFDGNYVYATGGNFSSMYFFKLNTDTGAVVWRSSVTWDNWIPEVKIFPRVLAISQVQVIIENFKNQSSNPSNAIDPVIFSLDSNTGEELWNIHLGVTVYNPVVDNNLLLFGASDGSFYALNLADGTIAWKTKVDTQNLFSFVNSTNYAQTYPIRIDSQKQRLFWSFAAKQPATGNFTGTVCSLDIANGNVTWTKQIEDMGNLYADRGLVLNNDKLFLTDNNALWVFDASTGDLVQRRQFDHYVLPPVVLGNVTFVVADLWLLAYA